MDLAVSFCMDTSKGHPYDASTIPVGSEVGVLGAMILYISRRNEVCRNWRDEIRFVRK